MKSDQKELLKKYIGKKIHMTYKVDENFRVAGTPQFNPEVYINGRLVYDKWDDRSDFKRADFEALLQYGNETDQMTKSPNYNYGTYDFEYYFMVSEKLLENL